MKWISIKDHLPKNNEKVLIYAKYDPEDGTWDYSQEVKITLFSYGNRSIEYLENKPGYWEGHWDREKPNWHLEDSRWEVKFWMPLPEGPHEKDIGRWDHRPSKDVMT